MPSRSAGRPAGSRQSGRQPRDVVPRIDLAGRHPGDPAANAELAAEIGRVCRASGCFVLVGHGVPPATFGELHEMGMRFFSQPADVKRQVTADPLDPLRRGFTPGTRLEIFSANGLGEPQAWGDTGTDHSRLAIRNKWPEVPGFREACLRYYDAVSALAQRLMRLCALALGLAEDWFDDKFARHMTPLTLNCAPPAPMVNGHLRGGPYHDFAVLTLRYQADAPQGLQLHRPGGEWIAVEHQPGSFVVNLGRLMTRWTNDRWPSTAHRVVHPPAHPISRRLSITFSYHPDPSAVIECIPTCLDPGTEPRYRPVVSAGYFIGNSRRLAGRQ